MRKVVILLIAILGIGATYQYQPPITQTLRAALPLPETDNSNLIILHLNVGQGDATLILGPETDGRRISVLIDAGDIPNSGDPDGGAIILKALQDYNIAQLDYFIASHYDADHIGGLIAGRPSLHGTGFIFGPNGVPGALGDDDHDGKSDWLDTKMTLPDPEELGTDDDIQILHFIDRGQKDEPDTITYAKYEAIVAAHDKRTSIDTQEEVNSYSIDLQGGAKMTLYAADGYVRNREKPIPYVNTENERSLCFLISYGGFHYLIGGDTIGRKAGNENAKVELAIAQALRADLVNIDVYHVNHHGANNASSKEFLDLIQPKVAIISLGDNNTHGHPHIETLQRLANSGVQRIYQTQSGNPKDEIPDALKALQTIADNHILLSSDGVRYEIDGTNFN